MRAMAMHLRVGGRFVAAMAVLLAVAGKAAFAQEHKTYRCNVADVADWVVEDGGHKRLNCRPRSGWAGHLLQQFDGVIIDTLTGAITHPDGHREQWNVDQRGDSAHDYVLSVRTPPFLDPSLVLAFASAATDKGLMSWAGLRSFCRSNPAWPPAIKVFASSHLT